MDKEYRVRIPEESAETFENLINHMPDWQIISKDENQVEKSAGVVESLTVSEAAVILGCTPSYLQSLARAGRIPAVKVGRDWLLEGQAVRTHQLIGRGPRRKTINWQPPLWH